MPTAILDTSYASGGPKSLDSDHSIPFARATRRRRCHLPTTPANAEYDTPSPFPPTQPTLHQHRGQSPSSTSFLHLNNLEYAQGFYIDCHLGGVGQRSWRLEEVPEMLDGWRRAEGYEWETNVGTPTANHGDDEDALLGNNKPLEGSRNAPNDTAVRAPRSPPLPTPPSSNMGAYHANRAAYTLHSRASPTC
ncbi:uncharacterized protein ARMOST_01353 [Armillaria ostoyae]|uniref:Uncharacterized protein n=1 Tax=Armillaria ostoyae TaxID=47428 RepID=A0A284QNR8_ARMOS|nr:uncharacterized protein ARMOST_01353 [Armillaria ostoyae]